MPEQVLSRIAVAGEEGHLGGHTVLVCLRQLLQELPHLLGLGVALPGPHLVQPPQLVQKALEPVAVEFRGLPQPGHLVRVGGGVQLLAKGLNCPGVPVLRVHLLVRQAAAQHGAEAVRLFRGQYLPRLQPRQEQVQVRHQGLDGGGQRGDGALHALQQNRSPDAHEVGVALTELLLALFLSSFHAVLVQAVDSEGQVLDGVQHVAVDVAVETLEAVPHGLGDLVDREAHGLAVQIHGFPCLLHGPDVVAGPAHQRQHHGIQQAGASLAFLDGLERRLEVGDGTAARVPSIVAA